MRHTLAKVGVLNEFTMSNTRNADDYPEHLNPFKPLGIRGSFRQLKRTIGRKFGKKTDENRLTTRPQHNSVGVPNQSRAPESVTLRTHDAIQVKHNSEIYPRSRFNERVTKAQTLAPNASNFSNPFNAGPNQEQNNNNGSISENDSSIEKLSTLHTVEEVKQGDYKLTVPAGKRYRRKKRAPLPPGALGGLNIPEHHHSQWSISSYETDCSSQAYCSETEKDLVQCVESLKGLNELQEVGNDLEEISKEIVSYCTNVDGDNNVCAAIDTKDSNICAADDTDNNNVKDVIKPSMPDLIVSTENDVKETDINASEENVNAEVISDIKIALSETETIENPEGDQSEDITNENINAQDLSKNTILEEDNVTEDKKTEDFTTNTEKVEEEIIDNVKSNEDLTTNNENLEEEIIDNVKGNEDLPKEMLENYDEDFISQNETIKYDSNTDKMVELSFVERKSIFIAGSMDDLDKSDPIHFNEKAAIYITGSRDELNECIDEQKYDNCNSEKSANRPVPKIRKNKPSRETLLNCENKTTPAESE